MTKYNCTVGGKAVISDKYFEVKNPATEELVGYAPTSSTEEIHAAVQAAKAAQPAWAALPDEKRLEYLGKLCDVLGANQERLAQLVTKEQGKPLFPGGPGSMFEIEGCIGFTQVPMSLNLAPEVVFEDETKRAEMHRKPIGVVAAIAPWNWPVLIAHWQIMPALRMGNTVVLKPSEYTPLATLEVARLFNEILPPGVFNTVSGAGAVGAELVKHNDIDKIMFTGSVATGKKIIEASGKNMARLTVECGGNDAAIILPGTKMNERLGDLFWGAFINQGQTCAAAKRLYVHEDDYNNIVGGLSAIAAQIPMGNGLEEGILLGPVQNEKQFNIVKSLVEDAKSNGADIICGGAPLDRAGYFYPITIVGNVDNGTRLVDEEQFGPVLPVIKYKTVDEALEKANALDVGLGASVWGDDIDAAYEVAGKMVAGTVWVNEHGMVHPMVPFGGAKRSGYGLEFGIEGLKAVTRPQIISIKKETVPEPA